MGVHVYSYVRAAADQMPGLIGIGREAPQRLVELLHARSLSGLEGARNTWMAIRNGHLRYTFAGVGGTQEVASFVGLCYELRRMDVLRAVIESGAPSWMLDEDCTEDVSTPTGWMRELSSHATGAKVIHESLYHLAGRRPLPCAREALELMAVFDPEHIDIDLLADTYPETRAAWLEVLMARQIASLTASHAADPQGVPAAPAAHRRKHAL